jgi:hypothetical protein
MSRPNPQPCDPVRDPETIERIQRLICRFRSTICLTIAAGWPGSFTCAACSAFEPMAEHVWRAEVADLARLGQLLAQLGSAKCEDLPPALRLHQPHEDQGDDGDGAELEGVAA